MPDRSIESDVHFQRPFTIAGMEGLHPAGTYRLVRDEEELIGLSFIAYRVAALMIHVPAIRTERSKVQVFQIQQAALDAALLSDQEEADLQRFAPDVQLLGVLASVSRP